MNMFKTVTAVCLLTGLSLTAIAAPESAGTILRSELNGQTVAKASPETLISVVKKAVARHPKLASKILAEVLAVPRTDTAQIVDDLVAAAIEALGPEASNEAIAQLVATGVTYEPSSVTSIVSAAVKASPDGAAPAIVAAAVGANPGMTKETVQAVVQAAMDAKPGLDRVALEAAVNKALAAGLPVRKENADGKNVIGGKNVVALDGKSFKEALPGIAEELPVPETLSLDGLGVPVEEFPRLVEPPVVVQEPPTVILPPTLPPTSP